VLHHIRKRFGSLIALDGADLVVRWGTVHALLGENGAGKTTLMRIAYGMVRPDGGTVSVDGIDRTFRSSADAIRAGVGMVHQHYALVPAMTVAENVALGGRGTYDARATAARVRALTEETGLALDPDARVEDLSVEAQQRVEIVKALARDARVLILDEPTAVLPPTMAADLLTWLRRFADGGRAVVLITHRLREALRIADDITVLRHGRTVLTVPAQSASTDDLANAMLGTTGAARDSDAFADRGLTIDLELHQRPAPDETRARRETTRPAGAVVISAQQVAIVNARGVTVIADASFTVGAGEIVGVAALEGQGQHELLRAIAGRHPVATGRLVTPANVGLIPEDRQRDGLILDFPLYENLALRGAGERHGRMAWPALRDRTRHLLATYDVRAPSETVLAETLSGGNQQKLVLARELDVSGDDTVAALVAENPTRGLDIQATAAVHERLRAARDAGMAIVLYASDLDEVLALADRVLVIAQRQVREVTGDRVVIGRAMLGLQEHGVRGPGSGGNKPQGQ
jgi:simple sugar transport system ATP-binding protein